MLIASAVLFTSLTALALCLGPRAACTQSPNGEWYIGELRRISGLAMYRGTSPFDINM